MRTWSAILGHFTLSLSRLFLLALLTRFDVSFHLLSPFESIIDGLGVFYRLKMAALPFRGGQANAAAEQLGSRDAGHFLETTLAELEEERSTGSTESVLLHLEYSAPTQIGVTLLNSQRHHRVDHVLKLLATSHGTRLIHLTDDDRIAEVFFTVVGHHTQRTSS